jgi:hypothetical protein
MSAAEEIQRIAWQETTALSVAGCKDVLAVDFDDTLTADGGIDALVELRRRGYGLVIFTANADFDGIRSWIAARWPLDAGPPPLVSDRKPQCGAIIDDKAYRFTDWPQTLADFG